MENRGVASLTASSLSAVLDSAVTHMLWHRREIFEHDITAARLRLDETRQRREEGREASTRTSQYEKE